MIALFAGMAAIRMKVEPSFLEQVDGIAWGKNRQQ
jgi:hypothetical protein